MGRRHRRQFRVATLLVVAGVAAAAVVTDVQAHSRDRHENEVLAAARRELWSSRLYLTMTRKAEGAAAAQLATTNTAVGTTLNQMGTTEGTLATTNTATYLQDLDIGTYHACLGGVQSALQQITGHNTAAATGDISTASTACLTLDNEASAGLVYPFDFPDPFVLRVGSTYFAYATNSTEGNIQIIESTDLKNWSTVGNALPELPSWAVPGGTWAPSVLQLGGTFVLYFSAVVAGRGGGEECIGAATATQPQGPFTDDSHSPLECQAALNGSIDPSPFTAANGTDYLEWKSNGRAGQPATIWSEQLTAAGTGFAGSAPTELLAADQSWQAGVIEAPDLFFDSGHYLLFYSGNNWNSPNYAVGVATCAGPLGPCVQPLSQPILASGPSMAGPGGETVFTDASGSLWMAFDAWIPGAVGYPHSRALYIRQLSFSNNTLSLLPAG
jgi:beta-xylosidase